MRVFFVQNGSFYHQAGGGLVLSGVFFKRNLGMEGFIFTIFWTSIPLPNHLEGKVDPSCFNDRSAITSKQFSLLSMVTSPDVGCCQRAMWNYAGFRIGPLSIQSPPKTVQCKMENACATHVAVHTMTTFNNSKSFSTT